MINRRVEQGRKKQEKISIAGEFFKAAGYGAASLTCAFAMLAMSPPFHTPSGAQLALFIPLFAGFLYTLFNAAIHYGMLTGARMAKDDPLGFADDDDTPAKKDEPKKEEPKKENGPTYRDRLLNDPYLPLPIKQEDVYKARNRFGF